MKIYLNFIDRGQKMKKNESDLCMITLGVRMCRFLSLSVKCIYVVLLKEKQNIYMYIYIFYNHMKY